MGKRTSHGDLAVRSASTGYAAAGGPWVSLVSPDEDREQRFCATCALKATVSTG
jgi:hypothetical protein